MVESRRDDSVLLNGNNALPTVPSPSSSPPNMTDAELIVASENSRAEKMDVDLSAVEMDEEKLAKPSPSRTAVEALFKRLPRFYKG